MKIKRMAIFEGNEEKLATCALAMVATKIAFTYVPTLNKIYAFPHSEQEVDSIEKIRKYVENL